MANIELGTGLKVNIYMEPIGDMHLFDLYNSNKLTVEFFTSSTVSVTPTSLVQPDPIDKDNLIACIDSNQLSAGKLKMRLTAQFPDADFNMTQTTNGLRTEIKTIDTGIVIIR